MKTIFPEGLIMTLHPLCPVEDLVLDEGRAFVVEGRRIAVFRTADGVFAVDDLCTHGDGSLSDGYVEDGEIECPLHAGRFDLRTGCPMSGPVSIPVSCYPVEIVSGMVHVRLVAEAGEGEATG